jgi:hypothetical protein
MDVTLLAARHRVGCDDLVHPAGDVDGSVAQAKSSRRRSPNLHSPSDLGATGGDAIHSPGGDPGPRTRGGRRVAGKTDTFHGERYRRIARRRGKKRAIIALGRSILVIVWHLLSDPDARFHDLGPDFYDNRIGPEHKKRNHIRQLEGLGYKVTLETAA